MNGTTSVAARKEPPQTPAPSTPVAASAPVENEASKLSEADRAALLKLSELFEEAAYTDEDHAHSGESDRYLRIASEMAANYAAGTTRERELQNFGFDLAALVNAARLVPGDSESTERTALLAQAEPLLQLITDCTGSDIIQPAAKRPAPVAPKLKRDTPIQNCGEVGMDLLRRCVGDIEIMSDAVMERADLLATEVDAALFRAFGDRINRLNSILISYLYDDERSLRDCFNVVWNGARDINEVLQ